ncbi:MAG: type II toxin-antitoxin system RelE/ParE family toxin [Elusimicrobia bacterium]|nr:type II toxin-antitoxin system RelE/ParE family toxin [Elusimicrobiota bacterium]
MYTPGTAPYEIVFYLSPRGESPVDEFLDSLEERPRAKIERFMEQLQERGPDLPRPYADVLRGKIRELRVPYGKRHCRLLYFFQGRSIVMTSGFVKKTPAVPEEEIGRAERRMADWIARRPPED